MHQKSHHQVRLKINDRMYSCDDCHFKATKAIYLKKHARSTMHKPSDHSEVCYTCKKEFKSYILLMNHIKEDHPSNKMCRYYLKGECIF